MMPPMAALGGALAAAGVALSATLLRLTGAHRRRVRRLAACVRERDARLAALAAELGDANRRAEALRDAAGCTAGDLRSQLDAAKAQLASRSVELAAAKKAFEQRM